MNGVFATNRPQTDQSDSEEEFREMNSNCVTYQPQTYTRDSEQEIEEMTRGVVGEQELREMNGDFVNYQQQMFIPGTFAKVVKKPRGRPRGSKNKPRAALPLVPRDRGDVMAPYVLEVPDGNDIVRAISQFSIRMNIGLCVLMASGTVANAFLSLSRAASTPHIVCTGHHAILSMSAAFSPTQYPTASYAPKALTVSLTTPNGNVIGGLVVGSLVSEGSVYVIATSFNSPSYHRLSYEEEERARTTVAGGEGETGYAPTMSAVQGFSASVNKPPAYPPPQYLA